MTLCASVDVIIYSFHHILVAKHRLSGEFNQHQIQVYRLEPESVYSQSMKNMVCDVGVEIISREFDFLQPFP